MRRGIYPPHLIACFINKLYFIQNHNCFLVIFTSSVPCAFHFNNVMVVKCAGNKWNAFIHFLNNHMQVKFKIVRI